MATHISTQIGFRTAASLRLLQTAGLPFIFLPSNTLAYFGVPRQENNQVSGMNAFIRNIGGSIGIALIITMLTRQTQKHLSSFAAQTAAGNGPFVNQFNGLVQMYTGNGSDLATAGRQAYSSMFRLLLGQASSLAYVDVMSWMAVLVVVLAPLVVIMRRPPKAKAGAAEIAAH